MIMNSSLKMIYELYYNNTVKLIKKVLEDSVEHPDYSAVSCVNSIWYILRFEKYYNGLSSVYVKDFLLKNDYSLDDFNLLRKKWRTEYSYYLGKVVGDCEYLFDDWIDYEAAISHIVYWSDELIDFETEKCFDTDITEADKQYLTTLILAYNDCLRIIGEPACSDLNEYLYKKVYLIYCKDDTKKFLNEMGFTNPESIRWKIRYCLRKRRC